MYVVRKRLLSPDSASFGMKPDNKEGVYVSTGYISCMKHVCLFNFFRLIVLIGNVLYFAKQLRLGFCLECVFWCSVSSSGGAGTTSACFLACCVLAFMLVVCLLSCTCCVLAFSLVVQALALLAVTSATTDVALLA